MTDRRDDDERRDRPHGRLPRPGRVLGPGRYRSPAKTPREVLARALRIAQRRPQALLKITRYGHGGFKILGHAKYITRHGKLSLEDESGDRIEDPEALRRRVRSWTEQAGARMDEPSTDAKRKRRVTAHFVLDAGPGADPGKLTVATREFLSEQFGSRGHEYVFARHDDTRQAHVHVILNLMDEQGKRVHTSVAEVQQWRERFAESARRHGIEVDASRAWERGKAPQRSRGPMRRSQSRQASGTDEKVRRDMEARHRKLLSLAMAAEQSGDGDTAADLRSKAAAVAKQAHRAVVSSRTRESERGGDTKYSWSATARRHARQVAAVFRRHADTVETQRSTTDDAKRQATLRRAAIALRDFAETLDQARRPQRSHPYRSSDRSGPEAAPEIGD